MQIFHEANSHSDRTRFRINPDLYRCQLDRAALRRGRHIRPSLSPRRACNQAFIYLYTYVTPRIGATHTYSRTHYSISYTARNFSKRVLVPASRRPPSTQCLDYSPRSLRTTLRRRFCSPDSPALELRQPCGSPACRVGVNIISHLLGQTSDPDVCCGRGTLSWRKKTYWNEKKKQYKIRSRVGQVFLLWILRIV